MSLKIPIRPTPRKLKKSLGFGSGPSERIRCLQQCVTGLIRHERIEASYTRCDETRGYAERLIQIAAKHGDKNQYAMEMADYWLLEKDLVHKLFKVLVPRYQNNRSSYTQIYRLPQQLPGYPQDQGILELKGNPYPPVIPKPRETKYFLTNILVDELRKEHERQHRSPLVNKILQSSTENVDIDSIQKQYIQENTDNNITESDGSVVSEEADVNKNHK